MIDLTAAANCIKALQQNGIYEGQRIGRIKQPVFGDSSLVSGVPNHRPDDIVLFREEVSPSDSQFCMGKYRGMKQRPTGRVTIETPLTQDEINRQTVKGSLLKTIGVMIGVPKEYVEEIRIPSLP